MKPIRSTSVFAVFGRADQGFQRWKTALYGKLKSWRWVCSNCGTGASDRVRPGKCVACSMADTYAGKEVISDMENQDEDTNEGFYWARKEAEGNGIGPVCKFCNRLIDDRFDHNILCPVREYEVKNKRE